MDDTDVNVFGKYAGRTINTKPPEPVAEMLNKGAFLGGRVGKGWLFVSCPHPEREECMFDIVRAGMARFLNRKSQRYYRRNSRTHTTVNSTTTGCTGSDGRMSAGGGIDRKRNPYYNNK